MICGAIYHNKPANWLFSNFDSSTENSLLFPAQINPKLLHISKVGKILMFDDYS